MYKIQLLQRCSSFDIFLWFYFLQRERERIDQMHELQNKQVLWKDLSRLASDVKKRRFKTSKASKATQGPQKKKFSSLSTRKLIADSLLFISLLSGADIIGNMLISLTKARVSTQVKKNKQVSLQFYSPISMSYFCELHPSNNRSPSKSYLAISIYDSVPVVSFIKLTFSTNLPT